MSDPEAEFTLAEMSEQTLFQNVDLSVIEALICDCEIHRLMAGDVLIQAGEANRCLYLLLAGELSVRLTSPADVPITVFGAGESVGEISVIDRQPATAFVVAESACRVLQIDEELMWLLVNTSHAISTNLLYTLARRMRFGNSVIFRDREQLKEYRFHATVDGLTGLFNRYWLNKMLPRQMERSRSSGEALSLLLIDVDHFKKFNDSHGHVAGDHALCSVATAFREHLRPADMAARYGGEEFVVLLPSTRIGAAVAVAERLRRAIESTDVPLSNNATAAVTISIGVGEIGDETHMEALLVRVDAALYRAKASGRNRVCK